MNIPIQRIDDALPLPQYESADAAGFDIYAREKTTIEGISLGLIPSNLIIQTPQDHVLVIASRSSTPRKKGLLMPHGIGIIDPDYSGPEDEILLQFYNFKSEAVTIERGERIGQGMFLPITRAEFVETDLSQNKTRGGFGSTG